MRRLFTQDGDAFTEVDHSPWYDHIEELGERDVAARPARASGKRGERSNFEGDRSNIEGDRGKNCGVGVTSAASPAKS